jgi:hypothetical protein
VSGVKGSLGGRGGAAAKANPPTPRAGAGPVRVGQAGEHAAGITKNTRHIDSLSGTRAYRVPDELTATTLTEVKNVARVDFTAQIRDSLHWSIANGRQFILKVRKDTVLSQPLLDAVEAGWIKLEFLP